MGQQQNREPEGKRTEATGSPYNRNNLKDRAGAKFGNEHEVNPAYGKGGSGKQSNPGKPV